MKSSYSLKITLRGRFLIYSALLCIAIGMVRQELLICYMGVYLLSFALMSLIPHLINRSQIKAELINTTNVLYAENPQLIEMHVDQSGHFSRFDFLIEAANDPIDHIDRIPSGGLRMSLTIPFLKRSFSQVSPCLLTTSYPFGIFESKKSIFWAQDQTILPKRYPAIVGSVPKIDNAFKSISGTLTDPEFHSLRDYQAGDSLNNIYWKATARLQKGISKVYHFGDKFQNPTIIFDPGTQPGSIFEDGLSQLHAIIKDSLHRTTSLKLIVPSLKNTIPIRANGLSELHLFLAQTEFSRCSIETILNLCAPQKNCRVFSLRSFKYWEIYHQDLVQRHIDLLIAETVPSDASIQQARI